MFISVSRNCIRNVQRKFHTGMGLYRGGVRRHDPTHPTPEDLNEALYEMRVITSKHNVYHPDEIDFMGFIRNLDVDKLAQDENYQPMKLLMEKENGFPFEIDDVYREKVMELVEERLGMKCNKVDKIIRAFVFPNYCAAISPSAKHVRQMVTRFSNQKLTMHGNDILHAVLTGYISQHLNENEEFLDHFEEKKTKMTWLKRYDQARFHDYMKHELGSILKRAFTNEALEYVAEQLKLSDLALSHFNIVQENDIDPTIDDLPRDSLHFMTHVHSSARSIRSQQDIRKASLVEGLIGAFYMDGGIEKATEFIVKHVQPYLFDFLTQSDSIDYPALLKEYMKQFRTHVEFRALKDPLNKGNVVCGGFIGTKLIASRSGETYARAKWLTAKKIYLDVTENPVRLKQLEKILVNQAYMQSLMYLKQQRLRDCYESVPGAYQFKRSEKEAQNSDKMIPPPIQRNKVLATKKENVHNVKQKMPLFVHV